MPDIDHETGEMFSRPEDPAPGPSQEDWLSTYDEADLKAKTEREAAAAEAEAKAKADALKPPPGRKVTAEQPDLFNAGRREHRRAGRLFDKGELILKQLTEAEYTELTRRADIGNAIARALSAAGAPDLVDTLITSASRQPYTNIHQCGDLYMERHWLVKKEKDDDQCGIRIHRIVRSDIDRHLHDHPGWSLSIVLRGGYYEELPMEPRADLARWTDGQEQTYQVWRAPGDVVYREAADRHRIVIPEGQESLSLFVIGPTVHKWGFYTEAGKVAWEDYLGEAKDSGEPDNMGKT